MTGRNNHANRGRNRLNPLARTVVSRREHYGLTQTEAARLVYVGLRTWQHWENGDVPMPGHAWELFNIKASGTLAQSTITSLCGALQPLSRA